MPDRSASASESKTVKTPYTPVFYSASQSSGAGTVVQREVPHDYLDYLSRKYIALAKTVEEIPSSRPSSPIDGEDDENISPSQRRVDALRLRVQQAVKNAGGDPADGRWRVVMQLLKLPNYRSKRWLGVTVEGKAVDADGGWVNAQSEKEWEEWEAKWQQDVQLKLKVHDWQDKVNDEERSESPIAIPETSNNNDSLPKQATQLLNSKGPQPVITQSNRSHGQRNPSTLGFPVIKRSSLSVTKKPKPSTKGSALIGNPDASKPTTHHKHAESTDSFRLNIAQPPLSGIDDISETNFLPPSFPPQLDTSTPNTRTDKRHKPEPIALGSSSPIPTPSTRIYGRQNTVIQDASFRDIDIVPMRHQTIPDSNLLPLELKLDDKLPSTEISQRIVVPKLTDLLASSKKTRGSPRTRKKSDTPKDKELPRDSPPEPDTSGVIPLSKPLPELKMSSSKPTVEPGAPAEGHPHLNAIFGGPDEEVDLYAAPKDYDMSSPTKSLSSLAASDSEDDVDEIDVGPINFEPQFASTQVSGPENQAKSKNGFHWAGYNSQFDVDGKVDMVSKFMEKDVDYDGWLKDPEEDKLL